MIPEWLKDLLKAGILFFVYLFGSKNKQRDLEAKQAKEELDWRLTLEEKREAIRKKFDLQRARTPNDWDELRKSKMH